MPRAWERFEEQPRRIEHQPGLPDYMDDPSEVIKTVLAKFYQLRVPTTFLSEAMGLGKNALGRWRSGERKANPYQAFLLKALIIQVMAEIKRTGKGPKQILEDIATAKI